MGRCGPAPWASHQLAPAVVVGAGYYVIKQLFPQMLQAGAVCGFCCCTPLVGAPCLGSGSDGRESVHAPGSALYGGCATLAAGPGQQWWRLPAPLGQEHLPVWGLHPPGVPLPPPVRRRDLEADGRDKAAPLGGEFSLCWAALVGWTRLDAGEDACLTLGFPPARCLADGGVGATAGTKSLALTVAMAVKRLHLCLLCVATAFPAAAGGPLLAGI